MTDHILQQGMLRAFEKAKFFRVVSLLCALLLVLLPIGLTNLVTIETSLIILFVLRGLQFFFNYLSRDWASLGRKWHQFNLFLNGLGEAPSALIHQEIVQALGEFGTADGEEPYFASVEDVGPIRLVENVSESAFYTSSYARIFRNLLITVEVVLGLVIICVLNKGFGSVEHQVGLKILMSLVGFFLFGDIGNRILELYRLEKTCGKIAEEGVNKIENDKASIATIDAKDFTFKYILALSSSIPLPTWLHRLKRDSVGKAWLAGIKNINGIS